MTNPLRAPWRKGAALSCTVFDAQGGVVASIFAPTQEEQTRRMHLVKVAPQMLAILKAMVKFCDENPPTGDALYFVHEARAIIEEAEPV